MFWTQHSTTYLGGSQYVNTTGVLWNLSAQPAPPTHNGFAGEIWTNHSTLYGDGADYAPNSPSILWNLSAQPGVPGAVTWVSTTRITLTGVGI